MEKRNYGEHTTLETRHESNEKVNRKLRQLQVLKILGKRQMTAQEIASEMFLRGYTNNADRNNAAPRLTELCKEGKVEVVGKKKCWFTDRKVTVYEVRHG